ncbi:hypothetical protein [Salana multivorans]
MTTKPSITNRTKLTGLRTLGGETLVVLDREDGAAEHRHEPDPQTGTPYREAHHADEEHRRRAGHHRDDPEQRECVRQTDPEHHGRDHQGNQGDLQHDLPLVRVLRRVVDVEDDDGGQVEQR